MADATANGNESPSTQEEPRPAGPPTAEPESTAQSQGFWQQPTEPLERQFEGELSKRD